MSSNTSAEPQAPITNPILDKVLDFSDRINPMLVKELRQGLSGWGFIALFITLQVIMVMFLFSFSLGREYSDAGEKISTTLFTIFSIAAIFIQPLRGVAALSTEIRDNTIDLMVMTRLSAWRIAFGKWISLFSQTLLLLTALTPYLILRYFFGGMELIPELLTLLIILVISGVITALAVGISAMPSVILRSGAMIFTLGFAFFFTSSILSTRSSGIFRMISNGAFRDGGLPTFLIGLFILALFLTLLFIDFGASRIAPKAENRATPRRLIGSALLALALIVFYCLPTVEMTLIGCIMTIFAAVPLFLISLNEPMELAPRTVRPFIRKGTLGKVLGRILYPGWFAGSIFALLLAAALYSILVISIASVSSSGLSDSKSHAAIIFIIGALIAPAVFSRVLFPRAKNPLIPYLAFFSGFVVINILAMIADEMTVSDPFGTLFFWVPTVSLSNMAKSYSSSGDHHLTLSILVTGSYAVALILIGFLRANHIYTDTETEMTIAMNNKLDSDQPSIPGLNPTDQIP